MNRRVTIALAAALAAGLALGGCAHRADGSADPRPSSTQVESAQPSESSQTSPSSQTSSTDLNAIANDLDAADHAAQQAQNDLSSGDDAAATSDEP